MNRALRESLGFVPRPLVLVVGILLLSGECAFAGKMYLGVDVFGSAEVLEC